MNKYKEFLENNCGVVLGVVVFLCFISVYLYNTRLQKVYDFDVADGDTVTVFLEKSVGNLNKVKKVRFTGIDCYEIRRTDKASKQAQRTGITVEEAVKIGKESKQILTDLLNRHKDELYFKGKSPPHHDGWGRVLGTLYIKDLNITDYMIADGKCLKGK